MIIPKDDYKMHIDLLSNTFKNFVNKNKKCFKKYKLHFIPKYDNYCNIISYDVNIGLNKKPNKLDSNCFSINKSTPILELTSEKSIELLQDELHKIIDVIILRESIKSVFKLKLNDY